MGYFPGSGLLIDYILSEVIEEFKEILVVSNSLIDFRKSEKITVIKDIKKNLGPLGGVLTAMKWIKDFFVTLSRRPHKTNDFLPTVKRVIINSTLKAMSRRDLL